MSYVIIPALLVLCIFMILIFNQRKKTEKETEKETQKSDNLKEQLPYKKKEYLLSQAENSFYSVLKLATKDMNINIFSKMRLADIVYIQKNTDNWRSYWNKIQAKHIDFIICSEKNNKPLLAIELNDSSHNNNKRLERDEFIDEVLGSAKIPLIFVRAQYTYNIKELSEKIKEVIELTEELTV